MAKNPRTILDRPAPPPDFTVAYGDRPDHVADVRVPRAGPGPLVLFLHGGFWRHEYDRTHTGPLATDLAGRGYVVASVEFRRTGAGGGWPATFDDVAAAASALPSLIAARAPVAGGRPLVAGHSAGGHLALWVAHHHLVLGVLALAPVADLAAAYALGLDAGAVAELLGGSPADVPDRYAAADPCALGPLGVPVYVLHGDEDATVPVELSRTLAARDPGVTYRELSGVEHFALIDPESAAWPDVVAALWALTR